MRTCICNLSSNKLKYDPNSEQKKKKKKHAVYIENFKYAHSDENRNRQLTKECQKIMHLKCIETLSLNKIKKKKPKIIRT